jgi:nucleoside-diphosphate-sugar epimerase
MKISILGCGWLGLPLAKSLGESGHLVAGSTTRHEKLIFLYNAGIVPYLIRFDPQPRGEKLEDFFNVDVLIIAIPPKRKSAGTDDYLQQLQEIVREAQMNKTRHILLISSTSVYADSNAVVAESDAMEESYGVKAENIVIGSRIQTTVIRFGGLFGPERNPARFLSGKVNITGADNPINLIHLSDCIDIIKTIVDQNAWGEIFNACADSHPTRKEFYTRVAVLSGIPLPEFEDVGQKSFKVVSPAKLIQRLNYRFHVDDLMAWRPETT